MMDTLTALFTGGPALVMGVPSTFGTTWFLPALVTILALGAMLLALLLPGLLGILHLLASRAHERLRTGVDEPRGALARTRAMLGRRRRR